MGHVVETRQTTAIASYLGPVIWFSSGALLVNAATEPRNNDPCNDPAPERVNRNYIIPTIEPFSARCSVCIYVSTSSGSSISL